MFFNMLNKTRNKGFTLLEILLVVAIISILAGIVIVAINPAKQLGDARNAQRKSDVQTILNGVYQYVIDSQGRLPTIGDSSSEITSFISASTTCHDLTSSPSIAGTVTTGNTIFTYMICKSTATSCSNSLSDSVANWNLSNYLATTTSGAVSYLTAMPIDPAATTTEVGTGYVIAKIAGNRVAVCAPLAENGAEIGVVR